MASKARSPMSPASALSTKTSRRNSRPRFRRRDFCRHQRMIRVIDGEKLPSRSAALEGAELSTTSTIYPFVSRAAVFGGRFPAPPQACSAGWPARSPTAASSDCGLACRWIARGVNFGPDRRFAVRCGLEVFASTGPSAGRGRHSGSGWSGSSAAGRGVGQQRLVEQRIQQFE